MSFRIAACLALSAVSAAAQAGAHAQTGPNAEAGPETVFTVNPDPITPRPEPQAAPQTPVGDPVRPTATAPPDEPLWELRLGGTSLYASAYPGSSEMKLNGVVAPLFIYRGDRIRFGEFGVARAIAAETQKLQIDVSLDAAYSARDAKSREGMPDIDYLFQVGPQLVYRFFDTGWTTNGRTEITGFLPVRGVAASDFSSIHHVGALAEPSIMYRRQIPGELRTSLNAQFVVSIADEGLMDYWYQVDPQYATAKRPAYDAKGGYLSSAVRLWWTHEFSKDFEVYLTYHGRYFGGSANTRSPLLEEKFTHAVSFSFVWKALKSKARAKNGDM